MRALISYFIKYPIIGNTVMVFAAIFGLLGLMNLQKSRFPERPSRKIKIEATYPGASPEEIEEGIVLKIEDELKGVTGVERVLSTSQENQGSITVEVYRGYDMNEVLMDVKNAVESIPSYPLGMEPLKVFVDERLNMAIKFSLSGDVKLKTLKTKARKLEDQLRSQENISKITLSGFPEEEIEIGLREDALRAYDLTFQEVANAVGRNNRDITGGKIKSDREEFLIRLRSKKLHAKKLKNLVVKVSPSGQLVHLEDVARLKDRWAENPNREYLNGTPAVMIKIDATLEEDIIAITDYARSLIKAFNKENETLKATLVRDESVDLRQRIQILVENGLIGFTLVLVLLGLFLNTRLAFWVALGIPVSFFGLFIIATFYGLTINLISLFGMILVIGILVDDGIVISENIYQNYEDGRPPLHAALEGTMEVVPAVFTGVTTTVVAFSLFFFVKSTVGDFMSEMAFVVIGTLAFSLIEGFLILPAHVAHSKALREDPSKKNKILKAINNGLLYVRDRAYAPALRFCLKNQLFVLALVVGLFVLTIGALKSGTIKSTFFPQVERNNVDVVLSLPSGTREHITMDKLRHIEQAAWAVNDSLKQYTPDSQDVVAKINTTLGPTTYEGKLDIILLDAETRKEAEAGLQAAHIATLIRKESGPMPETENLTFSTASPFGKPVSVSLLSNNAKQLEAARDALMEKLRDMKELQDVVDNNQEGLREIKLKLTDKARRLGLRNEDLIGQVRSGFFGYEVQRLQRGIDEVKVWVRFEEDQRSSIEVLEDMRIRLGEGRSYPVRELAEIEIERGVAAINHLYGKKEIRLEAELASMNLSASDVIAKVKSQAVAQVLPRFPDVDVSYEGQDRENKKTQRSIQKAGPVVLLLMLALIIITFRSAFQMVVVLLTIPFAIIGVGWGHYLEGAQISLLSMFGIIALVGVLINDSLVLISAMNQSLRRGYGFDQAIFNAGLSRFRPIILTSITTLAGLYPLILEKSFQAQFLKPMAISLAYGLLLSTFVMLLVLPVLLTLLNRGRFLLQWLWSGNKPRYEDVEPAVLENREDEQEHL